MRLFLVILVTLTLVSCGNYRYKPVTVKPTLFSQKGDFEVSVNGSSMGELHAAYALTDHFALSGTVAYAKREDTAFTYDSFKNKTSRTINKDRYNDNELAIGYFKSFDDNTVFEVFTGLAFQNHVEKVRYDNYAQSSKNFNIRDNNLNYTRFFIQPTFGKSTRHGDFGFVNRVTFFNYHPDGQRDYIWDSVLFLRVGLKNFKLMWQMGLTLSGANNYYDYFPFNAGFGLYYQWNQK